MYALERGKKGSLKIIEAAVPCFCCNYTQRCVGALPNLLDYLLLPAWILGRVQYTRFLKLTVLKECMVIGISRIIFSFA